MKLCRKYMLGTALFFCLICGTAFAQTATTHNVKAGETLFNIAKAYHVSVQDLKEWNHLQSSTLSIGQKIIIKKPAPPASNYHTVQAHETLFSIAKKYNVSVSELKAWNDLKSSALAPGDKLVIQPDQTGQKASPAKSKNPPAKRSGSYTVKSGDSLFRIAQLYNMQVERLKQLNNLRSNNIQVGQKLKIEPTDTPPSLTKAGVESSSQGKFIHYKIKKRRSREDLLKDFKMDEAEFEALNRGLNAQTFRRGDEVNLLAPPTRTFANPYKTSNKLSSLGTTQVIPYHHKTDPTTSGELYNPQALTAASAGIAIGSVVYLQNNANKRGVFVRINDRISGDGLKLSKAAWNMLGLNGSNGHVAMFRSNE